MKTAAICLAYLRDVRGVETLAEYFIETETDLFIHVDAKSDAAPYEKMAVKYDHVRLTPTRHPIYWGGFNTVKAAITSLEHARSMSSYGRFLYLTEDTIPLIPRDEYMLRMASNTEFLDSRITTNPNVVERYRRFFYFDSLATTPRPSATIEKSFTDQDFQALHRLEQLRARGKSVVADIYHGSSWWGLSVSAIDTIISQYHNDKHMRESFEFSAIPEEQYFHCILGKLDKSEPLLFTDWSRKPSPYIFRTIEEIKAMDTMDRLFLRKVDIKSEEIAEFVRSLR